VHALQIFVAISLTPCEPGKGVVRKSGGRFFKRIRESSMLGCLEIDTAVLARFTELLETQAGPRLGSICQQLAEGSAFLDFHCKDKRRTTTALGGGTSCGFGAQIGVYANLGHPAKRSEG
jgi:hypothetical protein